MCPVQGDGIDRSLASEGDPAILEQAIRAAEDLPSNERLARLQLLRTHTDQRVRDAAIAGVAAMETRLKRQQSPAIVPAAQ